MLADVDERMVEQFLQHRDERQPIQLGDITAVTEWIVTG